MDDPVSDVELLSPKELMKFVLRRTGEALDVDEIDDVGKLREIARLAAVADLSISQLKKLIASAGLSSLQCLTKPELRQKATEAVCRLRQARGLPTLEEAKKITEKRCGIRKRYVLTFREQKLGISIGLVGKRILLTASGDEVLYLNDYPIGEFEQLVDRIREAPRPLTLTFAVGTTSSAVERDVSGVAENEPLAKEETTSIHKKRRPPPPPKKKAPEIVAELTESSSARSDSTASSGGFIDVSDLCDDDDDDMSPPTRTAAC